MKYGLITPFSKGVQGKFPSYMANFLAQCLDEIEVTDRKTVLVNKVNIIYPIEYFPLNEKDNIIYYGPDNALMLFKRAIFSKEQYVYIKILCLFRYFKFMYIYRKLNKKVKILTVGQADRRAFMKDGFTDIHYFPHPVGLPNLYPRRYKKNGKSTVGISGALGRFGVFYCGKWYDRLYKVLKQSNYQDKIKFVVLGKQYKKLVNNLRSCGYEVEFSDWADDYQAFLDTIDVYMCLMAVGAGTKNRVLAANASGLRVLGTEYALENVALDNITITSENFKDILEKLVLGDIGKPLSIEEWERFKSVHSEENCKNIILEKIR